MEQQLQEETETNRTPTIILSVASLLLVVVGFVSFVKYVAAKSDTESGSSGSGVLQRSVPELPQNQQELLQQRQAAEREALRRQLGGAPVDPKAGGMKAADEKGEDVKGEVEKYDPNWNFITVNIGSKDGVKVDDRYQLRRGSDILGKVKITQVFDKQSIAGFVTNNQIAGALKPRPGDQLVELK